MCRTSDGMVFKLAVNILNGKQNFGNSVLKNPVKNTANYKKDGCRIYSVPSVKSFLFSFFHHQFHSLTSVKDYLSYPYALGRYLQKLVVGDKLDCLFKAHLFDGVEP